MQRTRFLGISMTEQSHRRVFVTCVYILFTAFFVSVGLVHQRNPLLGPSFIGGVNTVFVLVFTGISRLVFGALVPQTTFPVSADNAPNRWKYISIVNPMRYTGPGDPDERELEVRNRAYFIAFRIAAIYSVLLWPVFLVLNANVQSISVSLAATLVFPLIVMAITLPQAVLLWTEPDLVVD